ncbi:hypothetical protein ELG83_30240 (plasmid) [Rhizobium leguminosarum]|uniref:hypothetical protein n=1 Tax=Rhizobium TaxID=379 RepID=UPI001030BCE7|nr:hypothetical protein [Rhizobium leguminosarum]TBF86499.1 hypothetical protein ELG83_30240 [Rhizobium leguminosarum]
MAVQQKPLPNYSTLRSLANGIKDPEEFVRRVLANMQGLKRDCAIRVDIASQAKNPGYYLFDFIYDMEDGLEVQHEILMGRFDGKTHRSVEIDDLGSQVNSSTNSMHYREVQQLLGELRQAKRIS